MERRPRRITHRSEYLPEGFNTWEEERANAAIKKIRMLEVARRNAVGWEKCMEFQDSDSPEWVISRRKSGQSIYHFELDDISWELRCNCTARQYSITCKHEVARTEYIERRKTMSESINTKTVSDIRESLEEPFPPAAIKSRPGGGGKKLSYVETHTVIRRLNQATGGNWTFEPDMPVFQDGVWICRVFITIPGLGRRGHIGVFRPSGNQAGSEDMIKGCISDALKKAATLFGVGQDLYGPDYEDADAVASTAPPQARPPQPARPPQNAPRAPQAPEDDQARRWRLLKEIQKDGVVSGSLEFLEIPKEANEAESLEIRKHNTANLIKYIDKFYDRGDNNGTLHSLKEAEEAHKAYFSA